MTHTPYTVLFGDDQPLNLTWRLILEKAGCAVLTAKTPREVEQICVEHTVDVLVLCASELMIDCEKAIAVAESHRPSVKTFWLRAEGRKIPASHDGDALLTSYAPHSLYVAMQQIMSLLKAEGDRE